MSSEEKNEANAVPNVPQVFTQCADWGKGGRFVYDPVTQTRTRVPDEDSTPAEPVSESAAAPLSEPVPVEETPAEPTPVKKEKARA